MATETGFSLPYESTPLPTSDEGNIISTRLIASTSTRLSATTSTQLITTPSYQSFRFPPFTTVTNIGPLTSGVSFPTDCYNNLIDMNRDGLGPSGAWKTIGCAMSTCCPSKKFYTEEWAWMTSYYSPGVCPSDYQSCRPPTQSGLILMPREGEDIVFCCPNNCLCPNDEDMPFVIPGGCGSRLTISSETTVYTVMDNIYDQKPQATVPYEFEPGLTQELQIAYPIQIRFPTTTSSTSSPTSTPTHPNHIIPIGAIIGIAFGGFFSIFLACLFVYFILRQRRKKIRAGEGVRFLNTSIADRDSAPNEYSGLPGTYSPTAITELPAMTEHTNQSLSYINRKPVPQQTWDSRFVPVEMSSTSPPEVVELPNGPR